MFNFEKLDVWQEAIQFADLVYELTADFPDEERFDRRIRCGVQPFLSHPISRKEVHAHRARISLGS
jgi:hypothetical protein